MSAIPLSILWRGSLSSCNYGCGYCPFAKTTDSKASLAKDRAALERFVNWVECREGQVSILITPWGEALIRNYYRSAIERLSHMSNVPTIAIQTNLSCSTDWMGRCDLDAAAFWVTYHPGEVDRDTFLRKIERLEAMKVRYSVGIVGKREHLDEVETLRRDLPRNAYLWVNAYRVAPHRYSDDDVARLTAVDPLFTLNNRSYRSLGRACGAGESVISVDADGAAQRCHFVKTPIGNIYDPDFDQALRPRPCSAAACHCHIGYSHLKDLDLQELFGTGFLERRPPAGVSISDANARLEAFAKPAD